MFSDTPDDPRKHSLAPTQEEIDSWAQRERGRRQAWRKGPSEEEKQEWVRRYRRRAMLGLEESRLGPTREDVDRWAEREGKRREAWLAGPTEEDKLDWARHCRRETSSGLSGLSEPPIAPTPEEIETWAAQEKKRRQDWLAGPTEEEKQRWARRESGGLWAEWTGGGVGEPAFSEIAHRFLREAELAGKGSLYALSRAPAAIWSYLVRAGRSFEEELSAPPRRGRVPF